MMKARFWVPTLVVALVVVAAIPAGAAGGKAYRTTSSLVRGDEAIEGKLSSPKAACLGNRLVRGEIFPGGPPIPLGNVHTDGSGKWSYETDLRNAPPHFMVEVYVTAKSLGGGAICEGLRLRKVLG